MILELIENNSIILQENQNEYMCILNSSILEKYSEQWKFNRNLSNDKINQIKSIIKNKSILDTVLHFFYYNFNNEEKLICFDGNHRREALILLYDIENIDIKVCCYIYKNITPTNLDKEIVDKFRIINQMTPIPNIYNDIINNLDTNYDLIQKKNIIEELFIVYKKQYKFFYSVNSKCRRPNFNETTFKDLCNDLTFISYNELNTLLSHINIEKQQNITNNISEKIISKCKTQNFFLFI
jgi:hypothetical protein